MPPNASQNEYYTRKVIHQKLKIHSNLQVDNCRQNHFSSVKLYLHWIKKSFTVGLRLFIIFLLSWSWAEHQNKSAKSKGREQTAVQSKGRLYYRSHLRTRLFDKISTTKQQISSPKYLNPGCTVKSARKILKHVNAYNWPLAN